MIFLNLIAWVVTIFFVYMTAYLTYSYAHSIILKLNKIMASQKEFAQQLKDLKAQNDKARAEILKKIADLEQAVIDAGNITPEVQAAFDDLKASVQTDDDIVPDETGEPSGDEPSGEEPSGEEPTTTRFRRSLRP